MKLILAAGAALALAALPAMAQSTTVEFASSNGTKAVVTFNSDGTAVMDDGAPMPYTLDEETRTVCGQSPDGDICATFDELGEEVGFSTGYTNTAGDSGTATIIAAE